MKALAALLTAAAAGTALWVWRGERWALRAFEEGITPTKAPPYQAPTYTADSGETVDWMDVAMHAESRG